MSGCVGEGEGLRGSCGVRGRGVEGQLWSERVGGQLWSGCVKEGEGLQLGGSCGVGVFRGRGVGGS